MVAHEQAKDGDRLETMDTDVYRATEDATSEIPLGGASAIYSRQTILAIENDKYDPSLALAFSLARAFDTPIEAIFNDERES